jgi:hypothetical protein
LFYLIQWNIPFVFICEIGDILLSAWLLVNISLTLVPICPVLWYLPVSFNIITIYLTTYILLCVCCCGLPSLNLTFSTNYSWISSNCSGCNWWNICLCCNSRSCSSLIAAFRCCVTPNSPSWLLCWWLPTIFLPWWYFSLAKVNLVFFLLDLPILVPCLLPFKSACHSQLLSPLLKWWLCCFPI